MAESLYSDSPYLLVMMVVSLLVSLAYPMMMGRKMTAVNLPPALRSMILINIVWNICGIIGIVFFSGPMEVGTSAYVGRLVLFGLQAFFWVRVSLVAYHIGEMVMFNHHHTIVLVMSTLARATVVILTLLLIVAPEAVTGVEIMGLRPFEKAPIFVCFMLANLAFVVPFTIATLFQLLKGILQSMDVMFSQTGAYMVGCYSLVVVLAYTFDFVIPIATDFDSWLGSFHFMVWHQFLSLFLSILSGQYYTSARFRDKSSYWFLQKLESKLEDGIIYFDNRGRINYANYGASKLLGQSSVSLLGKSIKSIFPPNLEFFKEVVYSDVRVSVGRETHVLKIHFFKFRQTLTTVINVAFFIDQSKTLLLQQNIKTLNEQYVEYTHDLVRYQDRLNKEASIKAEKENVLNTLINALPFRVWYKSELGVYQKQNQKDLEKRGSREGSRDNPEDISPYENEARESGEVKVFTSFEDKNGKEISQDEANRLSKNGEPTQTFDNMYIPIIQGFAPYKTLCLKVDMTEQRRLEQERNMLREQKFIHSRLEELGTMCGAFAHDYNNILGSQIGFCQLAQEMLPQDHPAYSFVSEALKAAERGKTSLGELLNAIRGNANAATPAIVFSPYMIIEDVVKKVSLTLPPNISIHSEGLDKAVKIKGVVASLDRIISNLANNAIFAMKQTGGTLSFVLESDTLEKQLVTPYAPPVPAGKYAKFTISDTGSGMDSGTLERIFAPFFTTKAPGEGLGLGLSSALRLLKEGNAFFTVQTTLGEGTTFYLYWPLETETKEE